MSFVLGLVRPQSNYFEYNDPLCEDVLFGHALLCEFFAIYTLTFVYVYDISLSVVVLSSAHKKRR